MAPGGAQRSPQADLGSTFEDRDDHDVGDTYRSHQQCDGPQAQEQAMASGRGVGLCRQRRGRLADVDLVGCLGVGRTRQEIVDGTDLVVLGADVDGGGVAVEIEVLLDPGIADQGGGVDRGVSAVGKAAREGLASRFAIAIGADCQMPILC